MNVGKVVNSPRRQKFRERYNSQLWMPSSPGQIRRLQIQRLQCSEVLRPQAGEFIQELLQRLALTFLELGKAVKGIKSSRFAVFQNDPSPRHPVGALPEDEVAHNVERAPAIFSLVAVHPYFGEPSQKRVKGCGSA